MLYKVAKPFLFSFSFSKRGDGYSRAAESTLGPVSRDFFKLRILGRGETSREIAFFRIKIEYYFMGCDFNLRTNTLLCAGRLSDFKS